MTPNIPRSRNCCETWGILIELESSDPIHNQVPAYCRQTRRGVQAEARIQGGSLAPRSHRFASCCPALPIAAAQSTPAPDRPFVVEYYYKTKWGYADEFLKLFKKNHYPVLKKEMELGRISKVWMDQPRYHTTEDGRWDFRVTIVFKNAAITSEPFDEAALQKQLYPDQETFQKEEQRRFEILDAHWDLPIKTMDLDK